MLRVETRELEGDNYEKEDYVRISEGQGSCERLHRGRKGMKGNARREVMGN